MPRTLHEAGSHPLVCMINLGDDPVVLTKARTIEYVNSVPDPGVCQTVAPTPVANEMDNPDPVASSTAASGMEYETRDACPPATLDIHSSVPPSETTASASALEHLTDVLTRS
jgi:hypothetical protein